MDEFTRRLNEKNGQITPEMIVTNLLQAIRDGKVKHVAYAVMDENDEVIIGYSKGNVIEYIGMMHIAQSVLQHDLYDED